MGSLLDCFRGSNAQQTHHSHNMPTPDPETRRQAAADAASRRLYKNETRGMDEDELNKMKKRELERERLEQQQAKLSKYDTNVANKLILQVLMGNTTNNLSLCVGKSSRKTRRERPYVSRPFWPYEYEHRWNQPIHMSNHSPTRELHSISLSPTVLRDNSQCSSIHIVRTNPRD
ncbi:hypothetical protein I4U23_014951 [Adineta vaga]|nr:hypothetical protein I4U23_014951 [Adineta vaga]